MLSTQAEMDAFNQIPVNREYGDPMNIGYGEGQVDPGLASAVGGQDTTPLGGSNLVTTSSGDIFAADDPRLLEQTDFQEPQYRIRDQLNEDFLQGGILKDVGSAFEGIKDQGINGLNSLKEKLTALGGKLKPGFDNVIEIGGQTIDLTKSLLGGALSLASGIPGVGLLLNAGSASGAQQGLVADQFKDEGVALDDIGRIQQVGLDYNTPENVMAGYSPGETGLQIGDISIGGGIIQESIVDRLSTLEKTKNEKYGGSFYNADGTPKNNPSTGEPTKLGQREEALKENLNTTARAAGAVTLDGPQYTTNPDAEGFAPFSDTKQAGTTTYATDYYPELGQEENMITPLTKPDVAEDVIQEVNTIAGNNIFVNTITGEVYPDEVLAREDLETSTMPQGSPGQMNPYDPNQRASIIEQAQQLGVGNVEKHLDNNSKLAKARDAGLISAGDYNILGGYDVTQNITGGSTTAGAALNLIGGTARNLGEAFAGEQDFSAIPGTAYRNTQGGMGLISQDQKNIHNAIVNGDPYTDAGVAAIKNQIEMSRYQDPIMGMVNQNILADDTINRMTDDVDLDDFDTTPAAETARIEAERRKLQEINAAAERERRETAEREQRETAEREAAIERNRIAEVTRQNEIRRQAEIDRLEAARREAARQNQGGGGGNNDRSGGRSSSSGESDYGGFCFDPSTLIQMADGSTKQIKNIQLGDATKGGEVTGVFQFKAADEIHDYKGVTVAGSHYVKENGRFIMVKDSPLSVKIDKIPVVYSLDTSGRRIFINDIEFADYNGDGVAKNFLSNAGVTIEGFDIEVLRQVEQRLI